MSTHRFFTQADQKAFADLSGDRNPMHMDPVAARRTIAGRPVVHGVHTLLWALDALAASPDRPAAPAGLRADFTTFLPVGETVAMGALSEGDARRVTVSAGERPVMRLELRSRTSSRELPVVPGEIALSPGANPLELSIDDLAGRWGRLPFASDAASVAARFPAACDWLGPDRVRALLGCTRLVGMVCPGLHSVFNRIDAAFPPREGLAPDLLEWCVAASDARFRRVTLAAAAPGLTASLFASVRQAPVAQPSSAAVAAVVDGQPFAGAKALVVGGSRGLGELTAKVLAAGGAAVTITFARGQADAARVAAEIGQQGGTCDAAPLDVTAMDGDALERLCTGVSHAYYFATPTIYEATAGTFDPARFHRLCRYYLEGFAALCDALRAAGAEGVFYPSTVFLDEPARRDMVEYRMAKAAGEVLCDAVGQTGLRVVRSRLPMLATDQTAALNAPAALDRLLPLIRLVQKRPAP